MKNKIGLKNAVIDIILIMMCVISILLFSLKRYGIQGLYSELLKGIFLMSIFLVILDIGIVSLRKFLNRSADKSDSTKKAGILVYVFEIIVFPLIIYLTFYNGFKLIYNSSSDIINNNTTEVVLKDIYVSEHSGSKGKYTYYISGTGLNNKWQSFRINRRAYKYYEGKNNCSVRVNYYEKTRVLLSVRDLR